MTSTPPPDSPAATPAGVPDASPSADHGPARPFRTCLLPLAVFLAMGVLEPTTGDNLQFFNPKGAQPREKPRYIPNLPGLNRPKAKKGPLAKPEIVDRQFKAPVVAPGETVSGFFYYFVGTDRDPLVGSTIYMSGLKNMQTNQDLFYFEIPLAE